MGRLIYIGIGSLDGYVADEAGEFDWSAPDEEVHAHVNQRDAGVTLELYGRRLYEVMKVWQTYGDDPGEPDAVRDYAAQWRGRDKVVFSRTLTEVETPRTRLVADFDPDQVRAWVDAAEGDVGIGGATLAGEALRAGLVDAVEYYANPVIVGGGLPWLPHGLALNLRLTGERRFARGVVHLAYDVVRP